MNADNNGAKNNAKTETYLVVAWVAGRRYLTRVEATSAGGAEHMVLDLARDGYYHRNVDSCQAFDKKGIKTDFFYEAMRFAEPVPFEELKAIVLRRRTLIEAWDKLVDLEREAERLQKEKETATAMLMGEA